jgi:hypothetical protein
MTREAIGAGPRNSHDDLWDQNIRKAKKAIPPKNDRPKNLHQNFERFIANLFAVWNAAAVPVVLSFLRLQPCLFS